jgi:hypothetical protein
MATMIGRSTSTMTHPAGLSRRATVRIETEGGVYVGQLRVAEGAHRVSDVLADDRQFLSLTDVRVNDGEQAEAYMALNKSFIRTLRILDETLSEAPVRRGRSETLAC